MTPVAAVATSVYLWVNVTAKAPFAPRDGAGALLLNDRLYLIGGWNPRDKEHFPSICSNDVWSSTDGLDWRLEKPNTYGTPQFDPVRDWEGRHTAGYVVHRGRLWIVTGSNMESDVWKLVKP